MKVTYLHQHFSLPGEPGGSRPYEFARRLAADGHDVTVVAGGSTRSKQSVDGFTLVRVPARYGNEMTYARRILSFLSYMFGATVASLTTRCDVVFASSTPLTVAIPALVTKLIRRKPMVFEVRDLWPEVPISLGVINNPVLIWLAKKLEYAAYSSSEYVVALSPWMEDGVKKVLPTVRTVMIPNACDFERFDVDPSLREEDRKSLGWEGKFVIVYAGSFGLSYGLDWLVRLAANLDEGVEIVLYGDGASTPHLHALAERLGLDVSRMFPGRVSSDLVARRFKSADAVISCLSDSPVLEHNSLNKVFDGLAAGRPVLTNHDGWLSELVQENQAGIRLPLEIAEAKSALEEGLNVWDVPSMGERASKLGRELFDRNDLYRKLEATLESAAELRAR